MFFVKIGRTRRSTRTDIAFPTRRASDLPGQGDDRHRQLADGRDGGARAIDARPVRDGCLAARRSRAAICDRGQYLGLGPCRGLRSEEHTSELQSLMRNSYAVFCLKKKIKLQNTTKYQITYSNNTD